MADKVKIRLERAADRDDPNKFVGVNGVNYLLPKGKESAVPKAVAYEIERSARARDKFEDMRAGLVAKAADKR